MADSRSHSVFISIHHAAVKPQCAYSVSASNMQASGIKNFRVALVSRDEYDPRSPTLVFPFPAGTVRVMNKTVIEVQVRAVLPTSGGCAVFIGNNDKVFII